jgi:hypothetical protein
LFIPILFSFGASMTDTPLDQYLHDPTKISNALRMVQGYFQLDGLFVYADPTALAEAAGCALEEGEYPPRVKALDPWPADVAQRLAGLPQSGRVAVALEVAKRLNILLPDCLLAYVLTGPVTLARQLSGRNSAELLQKPELLSDTAKGSLSVAKSMGDAGIDLLLVWEESLPELTPENRKILGRCYSPLWNTARFYDLAPLLFVADLPGEAVNSLSRFIEDLVVPAEVPPDLRGKSKRVSLSVPVGLLEKEPEEIRNFLKTQGAVPQAEERKILLLTTSKEIPESIHKERMIRGIKTVKEILETAV